MDLSCYKRRHSSVVTVGTTAIGGDNPIRIQSMTTTNTNDTEASVAQARRIIDAGGELVRLTTQGSREAENLRNISAELRRLTRHESSSIWTTPTSNTKPSCRRLTTV